MQGIEPIGRLSPARQWAALVAGSAGLGLALSWLAVPGALMLGPMLAAIACAAGGASVRVPRAALLLAQGVVGCMIARMLPPAVVATIRDSWPVFAAGVFSVIAVSFGLGLLMARLGVLPGTTIIWGLSPGGAIPMTLMAEAYGDDGRLVAFMQYSRMVAVAMSASGIAMICGAGSPGSAGGPGWTAPVDWPGLAGTMALAVAGPALAGFLRFRAGALLLPIFLGVALGHAGVLSIVLPPWLLAFGYALVGWGVGLRFNRPLLRHAAAIFPRLLAGIMVLIAACAGLSGLLALATGTDPLTAYLALSPGGADTVAIITAGASVDAGFVMSMQAARLVAVIAVFPPLAKLLAAREAVAE